MFGTYQRLRLSVYASDVAVIKQFSRKMLRKNVRFTREHKAARKNAYRAMLEYHAGARELAKSL